MGKVSLCLGLIHNSNTKGLRIIENKIIGLVVIVVLSACSQDTPTDTNVISPNTSAKAIIINGYTLPPMPEKTLNDSTLLGIDSNANGVRDDVERYVIIRFSKEDFPKTRTALAMQYAWANQKVIENPTKESAKYIDDVLDCQRYWYDQKQQTQTQHMYELHKTNRMEAIKISAAMAKWELKYDVYNDDGINNIVFNTRERTKQDFAFNGAMSGGFYPGRNQTLENCQVNIDLFGE